MTEAFEPEAPEALREFQKRYKASKLDLLVQEILEAANRARLMSPEDQSTAIRECVRARFSLLAREPISEITLSLPEPAHSRKTQQSADQIIDAAVTQLRKIVDHIPTDEEEARAKAILDGLRARYANQGDAL